MDTNVHESPQEGLSSDGARFTLSDDLVRTLASKRSKTRGSFSESALQDEDWFAAKLEAYERPQTVIEYYESQQASNVTSLRCPTLKEAYEQARRWVARLPRVTPVRKAAGKPQEKEVRSDLFPEEWIRLLAFRRFEERGREHCHDKEDWFAAKTQLFEHFVPLMLSDVWNNELWNSLCTKSIDQAIAHLKQLLSKPDMTSGARILHRKERSPKVPHVIKTIDQPTREEIELAEAARSPISKLTDAEFNRYKGCLIALLVDGQEKGKVIAHAPLNFSNPQVPRNAIEKQVHASPYSNYRYQVRQVLERPPTNA